MNIDISSPRHESIVFAHEIRSPLTVINFALAIIQKKLTDASLDTYFEIIIQNTKKINSIVTDLLLSDRKEEMPKETLSLNHIMESSLEMVHDKILLKRIKVIKHYSNNLCSVSVNPQKIKIALQNIIINAVEAMQEETGELELTTTTSSGKCLAMIRDNGSGMSKEVAAHIFEPYYSEKADGVGIGLSNAYGIFLSNNAIVKFESQEGKGTCFIVAFNMEKNHNNEARSKSPTEYDVII